MDNFYTKGERMLEPEIQRLLAKLNDPELLSATLRSLDKGEHELMQQLAEQAQWREVQSASGQWYADSGGYRDS